MNKKMYATPAIAGLLALPIAGYTTYYLMQERRSRSVRTKRSARRRRRS